MTPQSDNGRNGLARVAVRWQPDSRLVRLVREGHGLAFDEIVRRYRPQLVSYAAAIVPEHHAEDVVQDALTRAHAALGRTDGEMHLRPWLHTIVRNGALNSLRDEPVHTHLDENYDGVPQPPDVAARREELAALTASVKRLPDQQREALVKRELEGRSHEEIATSLGLSVGAVRGLIYRARTALRDGAGVLIPLPLLRALLSSGSASPEATGAAGAAAAGLAGGGGGVALKAGATLGVAVIAVGSGIAVQHRDGGSANDPTGATVTPAHSGGARGAGGSGDAQQLADAALPGRRGAGTRGEGSASSGPGSGHGGASSDPGGRSGGGGSSGPGSGGSGDGGSHSGSGSDSSSSSGSGSSGDGGSGSGSSGSGDDGGGSTTSGGDGGGGGSGSSGSGGDDGTSGSGGGETSGHDGGGTSTSGSGSSGSGSDDGGSSGSGSGDGTTTTGGSSGSGSDGSGSGDDGGSATTTTTSGDGGSGGGGSD